MKLNRLVAIAVVLASMWTSVHVSAEEREGVLVPRQVLASRPIASGAAAFADRQLVQVPSPVTSMPGVRPSLKALRWTAVGIGAAMGGLIVFAYSTGLNRD
jgi:hypothetical protein